MELCGTVASLELSQMREDLSALLAIFLLLVSRKFSPSRGDLERKSG